MLQTACHQLLSSDVNEAIMKASSINILLHHLYDESLVYMAMKTGMKLCDIMYSPCDTADWGTAKCSSDPSIKMTGKDYIRLKRWSKETGEDKFYSTLVPKVEMKLKTPDIVKQTELYRQMRERAIRHCSQAGVVESVKKMLTNHPYIRKEKASEHFHFQTEGVHILDPLSICLGWFCRE